MVTVLHADFGAFRSHDSSTPKVTSPPPRSLGCGGDVLTPFRLDWPTGVYPLTTLAVGPAAACTPSAPPAAPPPPPRRRFSRPPRRPPAAPSPSAAGSRNLRI